MVGRNVILFEKLSGLPHKRTRLEDIDLHRRDGLLINCIIIKLTILLVQQRPAHFEGLYNLLQGLCPSVLACDIRFPEGRKSLLPFKDLPLGCGA